MLGRHATILATIVLLLSGCGARPYDGSAPEDGMGAEPKGWTSTRSIQLQETNATLVTPIEVTADVGVDGKLWLYGENAYRGYLLYYLRKQGEGFAADLLRDWFGPQETTQYKKENEFTGQYEEKCLDGRLRSSKSDPHCTSLPLTRGPDAGRGYVRPNVPALKAGSGFLVLIVWNGTAEIELETTESVHLGPARQVDTELRAFTASSFDGDFVDLATCFYRHCGTVVNGELELGLPKGTWGLLYGRLAVPAGAFAMMCLHNPDGVQVECLDPNLNYWDWWYVPGPGDWNLRFNSTSPPVEIPGSYPFFGMYAAYGYLVTGNDEDLGQ